MREGRLVCRLTGSIEIVVNADGDFFHWRQSF